MSVVLDATTTRNPAAEAHRRPWFNAQIALGVFFLAFLFRVGILLVLRPYEQPLRVEIHHLALSIATGHGFGNPYPIPTGPTALYTPVCPWVLAGIYRLFGSGALGEAATYCLDAAAASAVYALLPLLAIWLGLSRRVGICAAIAGALVPVYLLNEFRSITAVLGALCLIGLALLSAWAWKTRQVFSARLGFVFGAAWGFALLVSPNLLPVGLLWLGIAVVYFRASAIRFAIVSAAVTLAILTPWAVRNQLVLGSPILTRSNFGLELWIDNNDVAAPTYGGNGESQKLYQPFVNPSEASELRAYGEAAYMHRKLELARQWIERHPRRFAALTLSRVALFWFPITYRVGQTVVLRGLTIAAFAGLVFAWRRNRAAFWILFSVWCAYPLVYYLVQLDNPYRYPMYWSVLLLAAYACACVTEMIRSKAVTALPQVVARIHS